MTRARKRSVMSSRGLINSSLHFVYMFCFAIRISICQEFEGDQVLQQATALCNTTIQGRFLRSDDRGYVCKIRDISVATGCCPVNDDRYTCQGCNMDSQCCSGYEYCVSCCLNPIRTSVDFVRKTKIAKHATAGTSPSVFDYCRGRCRHNSGSVIHENAYASDEHHCFQPQDISADSGSARDDIDIEEVTIVIGRQGQSCDAACKGIGKTCKLAALPKLNKCMKLKEYLSCNDACIASSGQEYPAEVTMTAPRHMHPGACMYKTGKAVFSCSAFHAYSRRLCPCE